MDDRKQRLKKATIWALLVASTAPRALFSAHTVDDNFLLASPANPHFKAEDGYTMNFNNVSIIEYIRFVSKIFNVNFVFDEKELQFNVTIVSEDSVSSKNIMSALIQVLRIHNLRILEQENNLLITSSSDVNQIPTIISSELPGATSAGSPLITRVFRIKNANLATLTTILKPMISKGALIETSIETRQLIVTDVTTNVDKIAQLLLSLDAPHSPLEFDSYTARYVPIPELISLTQRIITPFVESNPHIMVPQPETNAIFIVSTPYLIDKTMAILKDVDLPALKETFFIYNIKNGHFAQISNALTQTANNLEASDNPDRDLITAIRSMKWIQETNSLAFSGSDIALQRVKELLALFDVSPGTTYAASLPPTDFLIYTPKYRRSEEIIHSFHTIAKNLKESGFSDAGFLESLSNIRLLPETNALMFTGSALSLAEIQQLLVTIDSDEMKQAAATSTYLLYKLKYVKGDKILDQLQTIGKDFLSSHYASGFIVNETIQSIKWVKENNSLLITGNKDIVAQIEKIINELDQPVEEKPPQIDTSTKGIVPTEKEGAAKGVPEAAPTEIYVYKPLVRTGPEIIRVFQEMARQLQGSGRGYPPLIQTLLTVCWIAESDTLVFTGNEKSLNEVKALLNTVDSGQKITPAETTFYLYKLHHTPGEKVIAELQTFAADLGTSHLPNSADLIFAIRSIKWIKEGNTLFITGSPLAIEQLKQIIDQIDATGQLGSLAADASGVAASVRVPKTFALYHPQYQSGPDLITILTDFQTNLVQSGVSDPALFDTLSHLTWISRTNTLLISGEASAINKVQELLQRFDVAGTSIGNTTVGSLENTNFLVYKLQYHKGGEITTALKQIATDLSSASPSSNQSLLSAVNSIQWVSITNSLIASGNQETLTKLRTLIENLDVPLKQVFIEVLVIQTTMTNAQSFGLQWGAKAQYRDRFALGTNNLPVAPGGTTTGNPMPGLSAVNGSIFPDAALMIPPGSPIGLSSLKGLAPFPGFDLGVIGDIILHKGKSFISLGSLVNALQTDSDSTVVLNPKIIAQDNNNATIFVGQNIPFTSAVVQNQIAGTAGSLSTVNIEYRDVGVNLSITPILGNNDDITLQIVNDLTQQTAQSLVLGGVNNTGNITGLQTTHTNMSTRVTVPDRHFVALSGMIQDATNHFKSSIPCLGGLPLIGAAFGTNSRSRLKNNIIIFIRPEIINAFGDYDKITDHQENLYEESAFLPAVQEAFEAGIDLVKTPENQR